MKRLSDRRLTLRVAALSQVFQRIDGMPMRQREKAEGGAERCDSY